MVSGKSKLAPGPSPTTTGGKAFLLFKRWLGAGAAMSIAEVTLPIDTAKVRLQIQSKGAAGGARPYTGLADCLRRMAAEEGIASWYRGLTPAVSRQLVYGGLRLCLYDYVRDFFHMKVQNGQGNPWLVTKVCAGLSTGAMAMCVAQPTDVVKIRFQSQPGRYASMGSAFVEIAKTDGAAGLWKGLAPNVVRNATINAAELATYDQFKQIIVDWTPLDDTQTATHWCAALAAGFLAVVIGSPIDVVKTRIMNAAKGQEYANMFQAFYQIGRNEGPLAFYQGFWPNFARLGSWSIVMFLSYEQIKLNFAGPLNYTMKH